MAFWREHRCEHTGSRLALRVSAWQQPAPCVWVPWPGPLSPTSSVYGQSVKHLTCTVAQGAVRAELCCQTIEKRLGGCCAWQELCLSAGDSPRPCRWAGLPKAGLPEPLLGAPGGCRLLRPSVVLRAMLQPPQGWLGGCGAAGTLPISTPSLVQGSALHPEGQRPAALPESLDPSWATSHRVLTSEHTLSPCCSP
ncbi:BET1-like protein isoform X1 [Lemur catta]|uniref:BET1-like protein isoform X1 n=1 Tax=Lemur catta TaxID=9447 RepID=UPI001E26E22F|nr:BET1-like protein isoform X1 [Lemur catta]